MRHWNRKHYPSTVVRSPSMAGDSLRPETTFVYDFPEKTVELYTTRRSDYEAALKRNPQCLTKQELNPGYRIVYAMEHFRAPAQCLKPPMTAERRESLRENGLRLATKTKSTTATAP